ncbi:DUF2852 domain-containing protein [Microvirga sp. ACRRW]|uniref:DUF2852 domain-containing protein n=1 Tax=Microvirga sp. ACRRW TaxID=2918205 RepID=UPI001EF559E0|nr:DUF2852 domain-containing protein [Microvirga sp. ACRRW]MCG7393359.1 DUF2852 domain-containing protein [Microvirga sp. ACRRW]
MPDSASTAWNQGPHAGPWNNGAHRRCGRSPRRGLEIAVIILGFIFAWPLALAYLVWKMCGYPKYDEAKAFFRDTVGRASEDIFGARRSNGFGYAGSGNAAFDDYRRSELERLEEERRKLDEEAREFRNFVEELKRAKDREEFDAFMAKRRGNGPTNA